MVIQDIRACKVLLIKEANCYQVNEEESLMNILVQAKEWLPLDLRFLT